MCACLCVDHLRVDEHTCGTSVFALIDTGPVRMASLEAAESAADVHGRTDADAPSAGTGL